MLKKYYDFRRRRGICQSCRAKTGGPAVYCATCREKALRSRHDREIYHQRREAGKCVYCEDPTELNEQGKPRAYCNGCLEQTRIKRKLARDARRDAGMCRECGAAVDARPNGEKYALCPGCRATFRAYFAGWKRRRGWQPGRPRACGQCRQPGHDHRTCRGVANAA